MDKFYGRKKPAWFLSSVVIRRFGSIFPFHASADHELRARTAGE
jgi:hypothetical protein